MKNCTDMKLGEPLRIFIFFHLLTFPIFWTVSINLCDRPLKGKGKGIPGTRKARKSWGWCRERRQGR